MQRLIICVAISRVWALVLSSKALVRAIPLLVPPGRLVSPACEVRANQKVSLSPKIWLYINIKKALAGRDGHYFIATLISTSPLTIIIIPLATSHWTRVRRAVHGVVSSPLALILGQHLLLLLSIPVAVRALLVGRRRHRLVAFCLCGAGVGAGDRWGGVGAALWVKGAVAHVATWSSGVGAFGCGAGCVVTIQFI